MKKEMNIGIELSDEELMDMIGGFTVPTIEVVDPKGMPLTMKYGIKPTAKYGVIPTAKYGIYYK